MARISKKLLSFALALVMLLSLGIGAYAEESVPREYVYYGYGMSQAAKVDMHELGADDITIDGVSYAATTEDTNIYIYIYDLVAAKLLRESKDKAAELGLDYAKLCISNGRIIAKEGTPEAEAKEIQEKVGQLTYSAKVGVSVGDVFDFGNGGVVKLQVEIGGFQLETGSGASDNSGSSGSGSPAEPKKGLNIVTCSEGHRPYDDDEPMPQYDVTTVIFDYDGYTCFSKSKPDEVGGKNDGYVAVSRSADDENTYYVKIRFADESKNTMTKAEDQNGKSIWDNFIPCFTENEETEEIDAVGEEIIIYTDENGENEVQRIKLNYNTPKREEFVDEDGNVTDTPPVDYTCERYGEFTCDVPEVTGNGEVEATIEIRGDVAVWD